MTQDKKIYVGEISNVHGIRGQLTVRVFAEDPALLLIPDAVTDETGGRIFNFTAFAPHRDVFLATLKGVEDRTAAEKLKGTGLYISRAHLPALDENETYHVDLIGMQVETEGAILGTVIAVQNFGASDLLEIKRAKGKNIYLPYSAETVLDVTDDKIIAALPNGLLELYE